MSRWQRRALIAFCCVLLTASLPFVNPVAAASFPDLPANSAAATAVTELAARGIIRGYDDGTFRPNTIVERRQMAATLVRALGWSDRTPSRDFPDRGATDTELWTALRILADLNVVRGFPDGTVGPEQPLTRQQAVSVIARAFVAAGVWSAKPTGASPYSDVAPDHQSDVALYIDAVGKPPAANGDQLGANQAADRGWYAQALWPAVRAKEARGSATNTTNPPNAPAPAPSAPSTSAAGTLPTLNTNFGVAAHFMWHNREQTSAEIARIAGAGLTTVRFDLGWRWVEPNRKGVYDESVLQQLDWTLAQLDARGITPIVTVIETPTWARPGGTDIFTPPTNPQDYADMMRMLAGRYAGRNGMTWEIWNEPNLVQFWATGPNAAQYTDMLRRAYSAIKAVAPQSVVLGGAIAFGDLPYLNGMYAAGAGGSFDALSLHPYTAGRAPSDNSVAWFSLRGQFTDMRAILTANGDGAKMIYVTEFGWSTDDVSDGQRAAYMREAVAIMRTIPNLRAAAAYTINAADFPAYGLIAANGTESATWGAYTAAAR